MQVKTPTTMFMAMATTITPPPLATNVYRIQVQSSLLVPRPEQSLW